MHFPEVTHYAYVPSNIVKRLNKNRLLNRGVDIKLAKTYIRKQVGGSVLTSILSTGRAFALTLGKTLGLSALAGLAGEGASQLVKEISGGNLMCDIVDAERTLASALKKISVGQVGSFLIPHSIKSISSLHINTFYPQNRSRIFLMLFKQVQVFI